MSALRNFARLSRRSPMAYTAAQRAGFRTNAIRYAGKESALGQEGRAEEAEHHKQDQLQKQKEGKGHWKDQLASDSESIVKADRGEIDASEDTIKKLQEETEKFAEESKKQ